MILHGVSYSACTFGRVILNVSGSSFLVNIMRPFSGLLWDVCLGW